MPLCRSLVELLESIDLSGMKHEEKLAFWINVHNAMMMHVTGFITYTPTFYYSFQRHGVFTLTFFIYRLILNMAFHKVTAREYCLPRWKTFQIAVFFWTEWHCQFLKLYFIHLFLTTQVSYVISGQRINAELIEYQILSCRAHSSGQVRSACSL